MAGGRPTDRSVWPVSGPRRDFVELLDRIRRANGTKTLRDIANAMGYVSLGGRTGWLRGELLPRNERQVTRLIEALGGTADDVERGLQLYRLARETQLPERAMRAHAPSQDNPRVELAQRFDALLRDADLTAGMLVERMISRAADPRYGRPEDAKYVSASTISGWRTGRHLPQRDDAFFSVVQAATAAVMEREDIALEPVRPPDQESWRLLLEAARAAPAVDHEVAKEPLATAVDDSLGEPITDTANLLLRLYIPAERLYAGEARRLLSLFREWLIAARGRHIRQSGYQTASCEVYEFFSDDPLETVDLRSELDQFSDFLTACSQDPSEAAELLAAAGLGRTSSADIAAKFGREVRRLQIDLRHERERMLIIRHSLEEELLDSAAELPTGPNQQIIALVERLVPRSSAPESWALLAASGSTASPASVTVNISPQIIQAMESTIIQNVQGTVNLSLPAKELLALIDRFGGTDTAALQTAVYELQNRDAPPAERSAAKRRLKQFVTQGASTARDIGIDLLEKYLESRTGL